MVLFYLFEAAFQIQPRFFNILLILTSTIGCAVSLFQIGLNSSIVFSFFIWVLAAFIFYQYNELYKQSKEQKEIYEGVLDDYRRLKRQALSDEKAARVEERARIAREMHDSVGHMLTALLMHIEVMIIKEKSESLIVIKEMISECLEETRRAVRALQTKDIEGISSVIYLIRKLESESHLKVHFTTKQGVLGASLSNQQSVALYRVIQEGLTNAMKHGSSREVYVILGISPIGHVTFTMKNSNVASKRIHEGFGLKSMRERLNEVGGKFQFIQTEKDFILEGSIPVEEDKND
ncbi:sensor histidine kinase [Bacillus sp. 03113]|uniref:sensor histidine kinase n=1 Tax=Bacillus sp. 03113 TaxID=2578211 RepID=UPI00215C8ED7|nr:histidine kinase [Bacillus sp. 03113]